MSPDVQFPARLYLQGGSTPLPFLNFRLAPLTVFAEGDLGDLGEFFGVPFGELVLDTPPATALLKLSCLNLQSFADLVHFLSRNFKHRPSFLAFSFFSFDNPDLSGVEFLELGLDPGLDFLGEGVLGLPLEGFLPRPRGLAFARRPLSLG